MILFLQKKKKGNALQTVLVVSVVVSMLLFAFFYLFLLKNKLRLQRQNFKTVVKKVDSYYTLLEDLDVEDFLLKKDSITEVKVREWGIYELVDIVCRQKGACFQKTALLGGKMNYKCVLYLAESNSPLLLAGNARILGNIFVSKEGVKDAYISGDFYRKQESIEGRIYRSSVRLPRLCNKDCFDSLQKRIDSLEFYGNDILWKEGRKANSFKRETILIRGVDIELEDIEIKGNIVVVADSKIIVNDRARLCDVLLVAPVVKIEDNVKGSFQVFASRRIDIGKNVKLSYPSSLFLKDQAVDSDEDPSVNIGEYSKIEGSVIFLSEKKKQSYVRNIQTAKTSEIRGDIYCEGNVDLKGDLQGCVYTQNFITKHEGSVYFNCLKNVKISPSLLSICEGGLSVEGRKKRIVKWLY